MNDYFLADDLSGALEVAAAFRHAGREAMVTWSRDGWSGCGPDDVVGFDTETRNASPEVAVAAVTRALEHGWARGGRLLYKKIDSTMRGPVAAELAAVTAALPGTTILFTPANPHAGRTVSDGVLLVDGVPVSQTDFGRDPVNPVTESSIRRAIPAPAIGRVIALDATTEDDLIRAIVARETAGDPWVAVGSGALARALAPRMQHAQGKTVDRELPPTLAPGPVLFVCGSAHPVNRGQAARLAQEKGIPVYEVTPGHPMPPTGSMVERMRSAGGAVLHIAPRGAGSVVDSQTALSAIVAAACALVAAGGVRRIMATGGETARGLCDALDIRALRVLGDVEPGLVLASAGSKPGQWLMAIKPGGFGGESSWIKAMELLQGRASLRLPYLP